MGGNEELCNFRACLKRYHSSRARYLSRPRLSAFVNIFVVELRVAHTIDKVVMR